MSSNVREMEPRAAAPRALEGKVVVITGAATGIGRSIALEMGRRGAHVVVNYVGAPDPANEVVRGITDGEGKAIAVQADVSQADDVARMMARAVEELGGIDVLVNNAGIEKFSPFLETSETEWDRVIAVDLKGPFLCSQAAAREMAKRGRGTILNISSVHEEIPFPGYAAYCAAKGGLRMLCHDLALELAPHHINVVNVAPGAIDTPINERTLSDPEKKLALIREIPLGRVGRPEEVAALVCYLASDEAAYITGTTVFIDGGLMRQTGSL